MTPHCWGRFSDKLEAGFSGVGANYLALVKSELGWIEDDLANALIDRVIKTFDETWKPSVGRLWAVFYDLKTERDRRLVEKIQPPPQDPNATLECACGETVNARAAFAHILAAHLRIETVEKEI